MVHVYLQWWVANDEVSPNDVTSDSRLHEETVRVPYDRVLLNEVVVRAGATL
jgi:hypothetical protein